MHTAQVVVVFDVDVDDDVVVPAIFDIKKIRLEDEKT